MTSLASRFTKRKQSILGFEPCLKPLFFSSTSSQSTSSAISPPNSHCVKFNTAALHTSFSSAINLVSFSSFNCSTGNSDRNLDCIIKYNVNNFSEKGKYKNDVSTFFSLCSPNDLSTGGKKRLMNKVFIAKSKLKVTLFLITKRYFCYN